MGQGWQCPGCNRCYNPVIVVCGYCGPGETYSGGSFTIDPYEEPKIDCESLGKKHSLFGAGDSQVCLNCDYIKNNKAWDL